MKALLRQSLSEGSLGFSSSHAWTHLDHQAIGVPSLFASRQERLELMPVVKDFEGTTVGYLLSGLEDRGRRVLHDGGQPGESLYTGAEGFDEVLVNGVPIMSAGKLTGALPGTVV